MSRGGLGAALGKRGVGSCRGKAAEEDEHLGRIAQRLSMQRDA